MSAEVIIGDDFIVPVTLKKNGATFYIANNATVKYALTDKSVLITPVMESDRLAQGADWHTSTVVINFPSAVTAELKNFGVVKLEMQVTDITKQTWFTEVTVVKSVIP